MPMGLYIHPFTKGVYIRPFKMLLSNRERMTSCAMLSDQLDIKLNKAIQVPKTYKSRLFRVLSTTSKPFEN